MQEIESWSLSALFPVHWSVFSVPISHTGVICHACSHNPKNDLINAATERMEELPDTSEE